ncbi:MAG TPA: presqualene diphosphate synthase HpnD [Caulobacteraceae bacterium]|jgi:phytoene synthase|nr:presqualene diphosphate synthase HpnD [Caulobacteraceae bacterium]
MTVTLEREPAAAPPQATTEQQASGSSFYAAMRLLPPAERTAMFAIYAFCRMVDDIADEPGPTTEERRTLLDAWRVDLAALYAGAPPDRIQFLAEHVRRFGLMQADFLAIVDGMEMDVDGPIIAPAYEQLDLYCDRVASAVGRLSVRIFGMAEPPGLELGFHLGRALQLTNILRDLDEDAEMGRLYLPAEALAHAGIESRDPLAVVNDRRIDQACRWVSAKAHEHYAKADAVLKARPSGRIRSPRLMRQVYSEILSKMELEGWGPPRRRVSLPKTRLLWIVLRHGLVD